MGTENIESTGDKIPDPRTVKPAEMGMPDAVPLPPLPVDVFNVPVSPVNSYQQEFLDIQNDLRNEETEKLQRENEDRNRRFDDLAEKWSERFLDPNP